MANPASVSVSQPPESGNAPRTAAPATSARPVAEVIALTGRDDFLLEFGEALGGQVAVHPVDTLDAALEQLSDARRVQLLVIDARSTPDVRAAVDAVQARSPDTTMLVFAPQGAEQKIASAVKGTNVFALLPIPVDLRKTSAVLEGAIAHAVSRHEAAHADPEAKSRGRSERQTSFAAAPAAAHVHDVPAADAGAPERRGPGTMVLAAAGLAVLALLAGAGYWFFARDAAPGAEQRAGTTAASAPQSDEDATLEALGAAVDLEPTPVAEDTVAQGTVDELLEKARLAMRERRYTEPAGDNALLYYRSAAAADPQNGEAADGLARIGALLVTRFEETLGAGQLEQASLALAQLKLAQPDDARIPTFESRLVQAQVTRALADGNIERAAALVRVAQQSGSVQADQIAKWRAEIVRRQDEARVKRLLDLAADRIRDGRLTEPSDDSAKYYVQQLREIAGTNSAVQRISRDLTAAYLRRAREAGIAGRNAEAERWAAEARAAGASAADLSALQRDIANARARAASAESDRIAQLVRERLQAGMLSEPAQDSAVHYLTQLRATDADHAAIQPLSRELAERLVARAASAAREGRSAQAEADLELAQRWGADARAVQNVRQQLAAARAPASSSASSTGGRRQTLLQNRLKRTRYVAPEYPERALARGQEGSVVVEFIVDVNGQTRDVRVVSSDPPEVFDRAAVNAVRRWRYEPVIENGVPIEVPARMVINFKVPD